MVKSEDLESVQQFLDNNNIQFHTMVKDVQGYVPTLIVLSLWFRGNTTSLWKDNYYFNLKNCGFSFTKPRPGYIHMYTSVVLYLPLLVSLILQKMKNSISGYYVHNICTILKWFFLVWLRRSNLPEGWGSPRATPSTAWTGTITTTTTHSMRSILSSFNTHSWFTLNVYQP